FIASRLEGVCGPNWERQRIPGPMRDSWMQKKAVAERCGAASEPAIAYADFSDYVNIIIRKDNWRDAFSLVFLRQSDIVESLARLGPIRICTMHARIVSQDDELLLCVEATRIESAIAKS